MSWWIGFLKRQLERQLGPASATSAQKILTDWNAMQFSIRCLQAMGGFKFRPPGLKPAEVEMHATGIVNVIANILVQHRAAEDVIHHHELDAEYKAQSDRAQADVERLMGPAPTPAEMSKLMAAIKAVQKAGKNNGRILGFPGPRGKGTGLGEERVQGDRGEGGTEVRS